jgi:hypothetical protein
MGNTQVTSLHPVQVAGDPRAPLIVRNESSKTIYYRANPAVSSSLSDGNLTEHQEVTIIQPTWFVTAEPVDGEVRVFAGPGTQDQVGAGEIAEEAIDEDTIAAAVKRLLLGTVAAEAVKTVTQAEGETGIEPSATKSALVTVSIVAKAEATSFTVSANGLVVAEQKSTPAAADVLILGTFLVSPAKKIKVTKVTGEVSNVKFSVQLMN